MATLPEGVRLDTSFLYTEKPTNTFIIDWSSRQISGMDDGLAAMRQAVEIALQNERFRWQIYSSRFGCELENLVGEEYDYLVSEIPRRIQDALSTDSRILSVEDFVFLDNQNGTLTVSFHVVTVFGTVQAEVMV